MKKIFQSNQKGKPEDRVHERKHKTGQTKKACRLPLRGINAGQAAKLKRESHSLVPETKTKFKAEQRARAYDSATTGVLEAVSWQPALSSKFSHKRFRKPAL